MNRRIHVCMHICMYKTYIHKSMYTYTHTIYIYTHTHTQAHTDVIHELLTADAPSCAAVMVNAVVKCANATKASGA